MAGIDNRGLFVEDIRDTLIPGRILFTRESINTKCLIIACDTLENSRKTKLMKCISWRCDFSYHRLRDKI